jgi:hypothetical protein
MVVTYKNASQPLSGSGPSSISKGDHCSGTAALVSAALSEAPLCEFKGPIEFGSVPALHDALEILRDTGCPALAWLVQPMLVIVQARLQTRKVANAYRRAMKDYNRYVAVMHGVSQKMKMKDACRAAQTLLQTVSGRVTPNQIEKTYRKVLKALKDPVRKHKYYVGSPAVMALTQVEMLQIP